MKCPSGTFGNGGSQRYCTPSGVAIGADGGGGGGGYYGGGAGNGNGGGGGSSYCSPRTCANTVYSLAPRQANGNIVISYTSPDWGQRLSYTITVASSDDRSSDSTLCSSSGALSTCTLRSAWALCMLLVTAVTCPATVRDALLVQCNIILPNRFSTLMQDTFGPSPLTTSSWALTCDHTEVDISISSPGMATVSSNGAGASFLSVSKGAFLRVSLTNLTVTGFGGAVVLDTLLGASFENVNFVGNTGRLTSPWAITPAAPVSLNNVASIDISRCLFSGNNVTLIGGIGGGLGVTKCSSIRIAQSTFSSNIVPGGRGAGAFVSSCGTLTIVGSLFAGNTITVPTMPTRRVYLDNGYASCNSYCAGNDAFPYNNELPYAWNGATCVAAGVNNDISCASTGADQRTPGSLQCVCAMSGTGWAGGQAITLRMDSGGLHIESTTEVTIDSTSFIGNSVVVGGGSCGAISLGAVYATIIKSSFTKNTVTAGGSNGGGAVCIDVATTLNVVDSSFTNNTLTGGAGGAGMVILTGSGVATLTNATFRGNVQRGGSGGGGAVRVSSTGTTMSIIGSTFAANEVVGASATGGAVWLAGGSSLSVTGSRFVHNAAAGTDAVGGAMSASTAPGSVVYVTDSHFLNNSVTGANSQPSGGGALWLKAAGGTAHLASSVFLGNSVASVGPLCHLDANGYGGAIYLMEPPDAVSSSVVLTRLTLSANTAVTEGGAIYMTQLTAGSTSLTGLRVEGNFASANAGAVSIYRCQNVSVTDGVISGNKAYEKGGAVTVTDSQWISLANVSFIENSLSEGDVVCQDSSLPKGGALMLSNVTDIALIQVTFQGNSIIGSSANGGAISMQECSDVVITNCTLSNNMVGKSDGTAGQGGAVTMYQSNGVVINNSTFESNAVRGGAGQGGALYVWGQKISILQTFFTGNKVDGDYGRGGGIFFTKSSQVGIASSVFEDNQVLGKGSFGGGVYVGAFCDALSFGGGASVLTTPHGACAINNDRIFCEVKPTFWQRIFSCR